MTRKLFSALAVVALAGSAGAEIPETAQFGGHILIDVRTGETTYSGFGQRVGITVYTNTASAANLATSSANLNTTWGDHVTSTGTGILEEFTHTIYNSSSSAGPLVTATYSYDFRNFGTNTSMGGFSGNVNFGISGLAAGFYTLLTYTGLSSLAIPVNLSTTDLEIRQKRTASTGTANRLGVAFLNPVTVGADASPTSFYKDDPASPPAGYYAFSGNPAASLGLGVNVLPAPASLGLLGAAGIFAGRRRR